MLRNIRPAHTTGSQPVVADPPRDHKTDTRGHETINRRGKQGKRHLLYKIRFFFFPDISDIFLFYWIILSLSSLQKVLCWLIDNINSSLEENTVRRWPLVVQTTPYHQLIWQAHRPRLKAAVKKQCDFYFLSLPVSVGPARRLQPVAAAAPWPDPACRSWPSSEPAERPWVGGWQRAAPSSTWPGRGRPGWTGCPQPGASPAERRCGGDAGRAPEGPLPPLRAPQTAREEESLIGSLLDGQEIQNGGKADEQQLYF